MIMEEGKLLQLLALVDQVWVEEEEGEARRGRGAPRQYSRLSMFKIHVVNVCKRLWSQRSVWRLLQADARLRRGCGLEKVPDRRTLDRRLRETADEAERQIVALGLTLILEEVTDSVTAAGDATAIRALGPTWARQAQKHGRLPDDLHGVDIEAVWVHSGYHGWMYGYRAHVVTTVSPTCVRAVLSARLKTNDAENRVMSLMLADIPPTVRCLLLDSGYDDEKLVTACRQQAIDMLSPLHKAIAPSTAPARRKRAAYLATDEGKARYRQRSSTIEPFFATFKALFHCHRAPVRGLIKVRAYLLGALYVWNLAVLFNFLHNRPLGAVKSLLEAL